MYGSMWFTCPSLLGQDRSSDPRVVCVTLREDVFYIGHGAVSTLQISSNLQFTGDV